MKKEKHPFTNKFRGIDIVRDLDIDLKLDPIQRLYWLPLSLNNQRAFEKSKEGLRTVLFYQKFNFCASISGNCFVCYTIISPNLQNWHFCVRA